ncbi:Mur ligase family protein, partial [Patescibacteria group bacterium]
WNPDVVVVGGSWKEDHPEIVEAKRRNIPLQYQLEFINEVAAGKKIIAIAGTHGKTSTTALMAYVLKEMGQDPSYLIGSADVAGLGSNAHAGKGEYFIVEADEYKKSVANEVPKFLDLDPYAVILTSVEYDHPDFFKSFDDMKESFAALVNKPSVELVVYNGEDKDATEVSGKTKKSISVGETSAAAITDIKEKATKTTFQYTYQEEENRYSTVLPGDFNALNAGLVITLLRRFYRCSDREASCKILGCG